MNIIKTSAFKKIESKIIKTSQIPFPPEDDEISSSPSNISNEKKVPFEPEPKKFVPTGNPEEIVCRFDKDIDHGTLIKYLNTEIINGELKGSIMYFDIENNTIQLDTRKTGCRAKAFSLVMDGQICNDNYKTTEHQQLLTFQGPFSLAKKFEVYALRYPENINLLIKNFSNCYLIYRP